MVATINLYDPRSLESGINLVTVSMRKPAPDMVNPKINSLNYLNSVLAKREAKLRGADEALVLNQAGKVAEASVANVFAWTVGVLVTPLTLDGALPGITRAGILEAARQLDIPTEICSIRQAELMRADEVFLTGTGARVVPVACLDTVEIGTLCRPIFTRLEDAFTQMTVSSRPQVLPQLAAYA